MSGSGVEQASGAWNCEPPPLGRQSSTPTYSQSHRDHQASSAVDSSPATSFSSSASPPPTTTYTPRRLGHADSQARTASTNHLALSDQQLGQSGRDSLDPDEYYRKVPDGTGSPGDATPGVSKSIAATGPLMTSDRVAPLPANASEPSRTRRQTYRPTSDSPTLGISSHIAPTSVARPRQTSFKDLINKFNNTSDQVLPLPIPTAPRSQETSRAASPTPTDSVDGAERPRVLPRSRNLRDSPSLTVEPRTSDPRARFDPSWSSPQQVALAGLAPAPLNTCDAIPPPLLSRIPDSHPRRPLFGERLSVNTDVHRPGFGIPSDLRRRGSEGSIHSPNPSSVDPDSYSARSPLTPTAWYLGHTTSLEAVHSGENNTGSHRRTRSDFARASSPEPLADPWNPQMAVPAPLQRGKASNGSPDSPNSRSRIPISSQRLTSASGPESLSPSSNPTFSSRSAAIPLPPKGISRLPKPSPKNTSPPRMPEDGPTSFASTARGKRDGRTRPPVPERSSSRPLQAYIAAPPPQKSPPLRSSRPRPPISYGGSTAPRSKVSDRLSTFQKHAERDMDTRNSRPRQRRLPELGNVDFETRRQRIQQAFNRTVQENERKEEEAVERRRRAKAQDKTHEQAPAPPDQPTSPPSAVAVDESPPSDETPTRETEATPVTGDAEKEALSAPLQLNTALPVSQNDAPRTEMDSPTLGLEHVKDRERQDAPSESQPVINVVPSSAVTTQSNDTNITTFDTEPQSGLLERSQSLANRTLLSQIMQFRESSSSSSSCDEPDCSMSENDDKESIQVVLRGTTYFDSSSSDTQEPGPSFTQQVQPSYPDQHRWSMSSWSSSVQNQHWTCDEQCDESRDDFILQTPQPGEDTKPATQSCSAASTSPASIPDEEFTPEPVQDHGLTGPATLGAMKQQHGHRLSTPPSLAKQGRWDSRRVTQLYLEELTRGRGPNVPPPPVRASPEARSDRRADGRTDSLTDDPVLVPRFEEIPGSDRLGHTASLVGREDWEHASPSIMDWMQVAAEDEALTPATDRARLPENAATARLPTSTAELDASQNPTTGLGLSINAEGPSGQPSSIPPPSSSTEQAKVDSEDATRHDAHSHSDYPAPAGTVAAPGAATHSTDSSEDSSFRRLEATQSPPEADSSSTSLDPSAEQPARVESKKSPSPEQRNLRKRRHIIKELVDTEYSFGRDMKVVDDIYKGTSSSCLDLSADDVKTLFANSDQVVQFSMTFQDALMHAASSVYVVPKSQPENSKPSNHPDTADEPSTVDANKSELEKDRSTSIGEAFVAHMAQMEKIYYDYLKNHDAANKKLQILQRNPKVAIWLKECREWASDLTRAWDLDSLLVKPVQRILKYPLLLTELLEATPNDHPDRAALATALQDVTNISVRINEMKKRADLVGQVVGRKRKESDVRAGLSKAFGRRTEKLRQQVGLSEMFEDKDYNSVAQKFGDGYFQLQLVMRDVEGYTNEIQNSMAQFNEVIAAMEGIADMVQSNYPELEDKWRHFKKSVWEIMTTALPQHIDVVRKCVIGPMVTLIKMYEGPQRVMRKRDKRLLDYARFKGIKDRGDKPDKKTTEHGEQFVALNETLKDDLPRLYGLTAKLMEACLRNFVDIQTTWYSVLQKKIGTHVESFPNDLQRVISDWSSDYTFSDAQILSLGICNGALLADAVNLVNFNTPSTGANVNSPRRPSTVTSSNPRPGSQVEESPKVSHEFSIGSSLFQSPPMDSQSAKSRNRADSAISGRAGPETPDLGRSQALHQVTSSTPASSSQSQQTNNAEPFPSLPRLSLDTLSDMINHATNETDDPTSPARFSGFFNSAMPMPDTPNESGNMPDETNPPKEPTVLFLAASIYEFNIDRARREAGYPYLTYVAGEIFDVIGEKGELWLARNQDDPTHQVGWIWNKHFAKLSA